MRRRCVRSRRHCRHISRAVVARQVTHTRMGPFARRAEVLLTSIETDGEHPRTHGGPCVMWPLVLALGHERLLGRGEAHEDEHSARHRALTHALRRELSFTLVVTRSTTREVDASQRWRAAHRAVGGQPLLRPPWNVACADVQPLTWKEQTLVSCGSSRTRNGLLSRRGACLNLLFAYFARVLQAASARFPSITTQVTRAVSTGGGIGEG